jgi:hypothetical protein
MSNVVSLSAYRAPHSRAALDEGFSGRFSAGASGGFSDFSDDFPTDRLARAQDSLADASRALRDITACLDEVASRLGRADSAARVAGQRRVARALEQLHQCQADTAELTRLIESGDIDGCERLRASIQARAEG